MRIKKQELFCCMILMIFFLLSSCNRELDKDGGYYDEISHTYKYVRPKSRDFNDTSQQVYAPRAGEKQTVNGTVDHFDEDAKSVWIKIDDRKVYMILAASLSGSNRDDKNKTLRLNLSYVSPASSVTGSKHFREQWKKYVIQTLNGELQGRKILAELSYEERSRRFFGALYQSIKTKDGIRVQDVGLWIVQRGFSFYFIDRGK
ncbi:MAG: hypothetical protein HQ517_13880, partial [SAR324 cluster bacterium]|nr:hypothetical protein [SAR324 cluster bacterium]